MRGRSFLLVGIALPPFPPPIPSAHTPVRPIIRSCQPAVVRLTEDGSDGGGRGGDSDRKPGSAARSAAGLFGSFAVMCSWTMAIDLRRSALYRSTSRSSSLETGEGRIGAGGAGAGTDEWCVHTQADHDVAVAGSLSVCNVLKLPLNHTSYTCVCFVLFCERMVMESRGEGGVTDQGDALLYSVIVTSRMTAESPTRRNGRCIPLPPLGILSHDGYRCIWRGAALSTAFRRKLDEERG